MAETNLSPETRNDLGIGDITTKFKKARTFEQTIEPQVELLEKRGQAQEALTRGKYEQEVKSKQLESEMKGKEAQEFKRIYEDGQKQMLDYDAFKPTKDNFIDIAGLFGLMSLMSSGSGGDGKYSAMNAMGNMGAAMQGYRQGRKDLAEKELKEFNANMQRVKAHNEKVTQSVKQLQDLLGKDMAAYQAKKAEILAIDGGSVVAAQIAKDNIQGAIDTLGKLSEGIRHMEEKRMAIAARAATAGGGAMPKDKDTNNQWLARESIIQNISDIQSLLKDPRYRKLIGPETKFTPDLINNLRANFPELSQKLARIQAIEFEIGGKALTAKEQEILSPIYGWKGLTADALEKRISGVKQDFEDRNAITEIRYPGLSQLKPKVREYYERTGRIPEVAAGGQNVATLADVKVTAAKNNLTEEEAKKRLRAAGYAIEGEE